MNHIQFVKILKIKTENHALPYMGQDLMLSLSQIKCHFLLTVDGILEKIVKKKQWKAIGFFANVVKIFQQLSE